MQSNLKAQTPGWFEYWPEEQLVHAEQPAMCNSTICVVTQGHCDPIIIYDT